MNDARRFITLVKEAVFLVWLLVFIWSLSVLDHLVRLVDHGGWFNLVVVIGGSMAVVSASHTALALRRLVKDAKIR